MDSLKNPRPLGLGSIKPWFILIVSIAVALLEAPGALAKIYSTNDEFKLYQVKQKLESEQDCTPILQINFTRPSSALSFYQGLCLLRNGQHLPALEKFHEAVKLDPNNTEALNNIGIIYGYYSEKKQEALDIYDKIIATNPNQIEFRMNRALLLEQVGKPQEALEELKKVLKIKPDNNLAWYTMSLIQYNLGNYKDAISKINRAIWLNPNFIENYTLRGLIRIKRGDRNNGCKDLKKASQGGKSPYALIHLENYCK
jgi:tetratricopeptide (TPR) repeat protein